MLRRPVSHAVILLSVVAAVICALGSQYAIKNLVDIVAKGETTLVMTAFLILVGLIFADNLLWRVGGWFASRVFVRVSGDVRRDLFQHVTHHSPGYFADRLPGMLAGRISATANALFTTENTFAWNVLPPTIAVIGAIIVLSMVNPTMAGTLVVIAALLIAIIYVLAKRGAPLHHEYAANAAKVEGELVDVLSNMNAVRLFGATVMEQERLSDKIEVEMRARQRSLRYLEIIRLVHGVVTATLTAGLLAWALLLWSQGKASPGDIVLVSSLGFAILHGTRDLAVALVDLTQHVARLSEAVSTLLIPHALPDAPHARPFVIGHGRGARIDFEDVQFSYPQRKPILQNFDLHIRAGERVGLVGPSGAGKSTVLTLLQRFYDVQQGRIRINGLDITDLKQESLRQAIAVVPQDISLFHRSILENIRYGRPDATDDEVLAAAEAASCRGFIDALPQGFDTIVGERGLKLSGGQRQRLALARAFLKDAPILVLDEATSALDSESEAAIQKALNRLMRGRSVIAIAHRLSTLQSFDRIVVMDHGRVVDQGSPKELSARPGLYRDLLLRQTGSSHLAATA
ncbi:ABC transporter ATP-binding protein [uncultured Ferrovibrio sp.]|jgi:ABC-type multidrug transport system, ATPase and permease components|uniref:ABC transporter ATP-binding protein n=1 Tax=uncultured Ferrovibrio sp. TaxID=1576913 RepID=UPI00262EFC09|nr:ABC transporter ATP-binding protein [uncultured Ferrovibrio sp.]